MNAVRATVCALRSHAPISVECLFSMTLLRGGGVRLGVPHHRLRQEGRPLHPGRGLHSFTSQLNLSRF